MRTPLQVVTEIVAIVALIALAVVVMVSAVARNLPLVAEAALEAALLAMLAGPLLAWRVRVWADGLAHSSASRARRPVSAAMASCGVAVGGVALTAVATGLMHRAVEREASEQFSMLSERVEHEVQRRMDLFAYGLHGLRGAFMVSEQVTGEEFRRYYDSRDIEREFVGAAGIGFIERVGDIGSAMPVRFAEPQDRIGDAVGLDLATTPLRREAAVAAARGGGPVFTEAHALAEVAGRPVGILALMPVYAPGAPIDSAGARERACIGWVYNPVVIEEALSNAAGVAEDRIGLTVHDVADGDRVLHAGNTAAVTGSRRSTHQIEVGGRRWALRMGATEAFEASLHRERVAATGAAGALLTLMLTGLVWSLSTSRSRATALAAAMTADLRAAKASAEASLRENRMLAEVARRTRNAAVLTDPSGVTVWVNDGFTRITGYAPSEAVGRRPGDLLQGPATDRAEAARIGDAVRAGVGCEAELINYAKDGREYIIRIEVEPLYGDAGEIAGFMAIETDVTEQRRAEAELRRSERRNRAILEGADVIAWEYDSATDRFTYVSPQAERLGYTLEEWMSPGFWHRTLHPEDAQATIEECLAESAAGRSHRLQYRMLHANGGSVWIDDFVAVERHENGSRTLRGVMIDITEARELRESAEAASRAKSEFLANMSHEIRTPLTAILGYTDLLRDAESGDAGSPAARLETIETIRAAGEHLVTIINDILDLSKIEAGRVTVERTPTDLAAMLWDMQSMMRPRTEPKEIALACALATPTPRVILTDPTRLRQVLLNLVGNACKFTQRGEVRVVVGVATDEGGDRLRIDVEDTGPGMDASQTRSLFRPFSQADSSTTRRFGGTGLGLSISRRLAGLLGGDVTLVRTTPGEGSCFRAEIALEAAPGSPVMECLPEVSPGSGAPAPAVRVESISGRVLLVEDGPDNRRLIATILQRAGCEVALAANGVEALALIDGAPAPFDLIVSDMQMPEMDGYTLARTLRERGDDTPLVALTAHAMTEDRDRCLEAGCDAYASKPVDRQRLLSICAAWIGRRSDRAGERQAA
jgi:PAS domain S-box-containing protein